MDIALSFEDLKGFLGSPRTFQTKVRGDLPKGRGIAVIAEIIFQKIEYSFLCRCEFIFHLIFPTGRDGSRPTKTFILKFP